MNEINKEVTDLVPVTEIWSQSDINIEAQEEAYKTKLIDLYGSDIMLDCFYTMDCLLHLAMQNYCQTQRKSQHEDRAIKLRDVMSEHLFRPMDAKKAERLERCRNVAFEMTFAYEDEKHTFAIFVLAAVAEVENQQNAQAAYVRAKKETDFVRDHHGPESEEFRKLWG